jgi:hypothetical protein
MPTLIAIGNLFPGEVHFWVWHNAVRGGNYSFIAWPFRAANGPEPHSAHVNTEIIELAEEANTEESPLEDQVRFKVTNTGGFCGYDLFISFDPPGP